MNKSTQRELDTIAMYLRLQDHGGQRMAETSADILLRSAPTAKLSGEIKAALAAMGLPTEIRYL